MIAHHVSQSVAHAVTKPLLKASLTSLDDCLAHVLNLDALLAGVLFHASSYSSYMYSSVSILNNRRGSTANGRPPRHILWSSLIFTSPCGSLPH